MRKAIAGVTAALFLGVAGAACVAVYRINARVTALRHEVNEAGNLPFRMVTLGGRVAGAGFERLGTSNRFTTGAAFEGKLYLAGGAGLAVYDSVKAEPRLLRTGVELPAEPIVAFGSGRVRGDAVASLLAATHGEGLLLIGAAGTRQLRPDDASARDMTAVLPLASGDVLIGTRHAGLLLFDGKTLRVFQPSFAGVDVTALAGDEGDFWVGTRTRGVLHWHAGQVDAFGAGDGWLPDVQVEDLAMSAEGVFVGTPLGVAQFVNGRPVRVLAKGIFAHALAVEGGSLVVATIDQGVREVSLKAQGRMRLNVAAEVDPLKVERLLRVDGRLLAVAGGGLLRREERGDWQKVVDAPAQALSDDNVTSLSFAPDGRLWIGYFDRGVDVLDLSTHHAEHVEDDHVFCVNRIVPDAGRHTMNVATANGLALFGDGAGEPRVRQVLSQKDGLISDQVTDVAFTKAGMVAATPAGLTFFTASGAQSLYAFQGLVNNHVYAMSARPEDSLVVAGTLGGISMLENETVRQNVTLKNSGLKRNWITALVRVRDDGDGWFVGTYGGGVVRMDAAGRVSGMEGAPAGSVMVKAVINPNAMLVTARSVLAGSLDDGLLVYDRGSRRWSRVVEGLPSRNVTALAERGGEVYIGTDNGIVHITEARLP